MVFTATSTLAIRALAHLAAREEEAATLGRDLAAEVGVPAPYLAKVLATLARAGVLTASRGARGGYRLARPAATIALVEIVEPIEGKRVRPGCLLRPGQPCQEDNACSAHSAWSIAKTAYLEFLENTTLSDIRGADGEPSRAGRPTPGRKTRREARPPVRGRRAGGGT